MPATPDTTGRSDEALAIAVRNGDTGAFDTLYARYHRRIFAYVRRMLGGDDARAEELLQDVFLRLVERSDAFDPDRRFSTWIFAVAANLCRNEYRHRDVVSRAHAELKSTPLSTGPGVESRIDSERFESALFAELESLSEELRSVFLLRHQQELALKDIADVLGCPLGTVKSRLHSATRQLADRLRHLHPERTDCERPSDV